MTLVLEYQPKEEKYHPVPKYLATCYLGLEVRGILGYLLVCHLQCQKKPDHTSVYRTPYRIHVHVLVLLSGRMAEATSA